LKPFSRHFLPLSLPEVYHNTWLSFRGLGHDGSWKNDLHWHDLRHTTATYLEDTDVPGEKIRAIMGHADASVTDIYKNLHPIKKVQKLIPYVECLDRYLADIYWRPIPCGSHVEEPNKNDINRYEPMTNRKSLQVVAPHCIHKLFEKRGKVPSVDEVIDNIVRLSLRFEQQLSATVMNLEITT
jgi:hypothetical protein